MSEMQVANIHVCIERAENSICYVEHSFLREGGEVTSLLAIILINISIPYFHCFLLSTDLTKFWLVG